MVDGRLGDWRIEAVTTVAATETKVAPGSPVRLMSFAKHRELRYLSFIMPSASALALSVASTSAAMAESLRPRLLKSEVRTPKGERGFQIRDESINDLYVFFEQSMVAIVMSFQALELFANATIGRSTRQKINIVRGKQALTLTPAEAERQLSTEEKFKQGVA